MNEIANSLSKTEKFKDLINEIKLKNGPINILGLVDVAKSQLIYGTKEEIKRPVCIITYNELQAKKLVKDISYFCDNVAYFPKKEIVTYDYIAESKDLLYERMEVLNKIYSGKMDILVTTVESCMQNMITKNDLYKDIIKFEFNKEYNFEKLKQRLVDLGYERVELVESKGQFSVRGDIIDIGLAQKHGVRVEFWGEEIDSIRYFNISSQRSTEELKEITIYPSHEYILSKDINEVIEKIENKNVNSEEDIEQVKNRKLFK